MNLIYKYYPEDSSVVEDDFNIPITINYICLEIEFTVDKAEKQSKFFPGELGEIKIESISILYITCFEFPELKIYVLGDQKDILEALVDSYELYDILREAWRKENEKLQN